MEPTFFPTPAAFRKWLEKHHHSEEELLVGFYKKGSGKRSITWPESVDQALCFGWIDGVRKRIDDDSYTIRFTPRRRGSHWSAVNIRRAQELIAEGLMMPAGLNAFEQRTEYESAPYSYEQPPKTLPPQYAKQFRAKRKAWEYFNAQPPGYRRVVLHWVLSAKKEETRTRRLATLIDDSAHGRRIAGYTLEPRSTAPIRRDRGRSRDRAGARERPASPGARRTSAPRTRRRRPRSARPASRR
jgi:uncharacterized protein YdeI (YjbR/CyaY-like superfamily)